MRKLVALYSLALVPRILGAFFLPNAFGDAYAYIQEIGTLSTKLSNGSFDLTDLFGFWLPLYQFISALLNLVIRNGFYSGKIIAALFGAATCVFVYLATTRLTNNETAARWMFVLIAFNPLHIFYSASAMTDVPHAFFVLAALYFVLTENWIIAAIFAALAGLTRVESWMLIALLPFLQFARERRISIVAFIILALPPLFWFYISWKATGNWLECFVQRQQYHDWLLRMNPAIAHFSFVNVLKDTSTLLISSDVTVLIASFAAAWFVLKNPRSLFTRPLNCDQPGATWPPLLFFFAFLALLVLAYLTHQQPIIFARYGLILFTLGLPILAWTFLFIQRRRPQIARTSLIVIVVLCSVDASIQLAGAVGTVKQYRVQRAVADYLRDHFDRNSGTRIFCDEGTVRVLSGIADQRFITSAEASKDEARFKSFLQTNHVEYIVVAKVQGSIVTPKMAASEPQFDSFETVFHSRTAFPPTDIWLLRAKEVK